jgi:hypothetical protein
MMQPVWGMAIMDVRIYIFQFILKYSHLGLIVEIQLPYLYSITYYSFLINWDLGIVNINQVIESTM